MMHPLTVVFASDENGALPLSVAAWSVVESALPDTKYDICILNSGLSSVTQKKITSLILKAGERHSVRFIDVTNVIPDNVVVKEQWPKSAWARVFLADILPDVKRCLYLDIDTLTCTDLNKLFQTDMGDAALGVVLEHESHEGSHFNKRLEIPQTCLGYFNSGVLLMNLEAFRRDNLIKKVMEYANIHRDVLNCPDQDALNGALCDSLIQLHPRWNWHDGLTRLIIKANPKDKLWRGNSPQSSIEAALWPGILHFQGKNKPWKYCYRIEKSRYEQSMLRAGIVSKLPLPGFSFTAWLKNILYKPMYAFTWWKIRRLARQFGVHQL
ncbi:MAG: glycosyltransferase family 8 protein [Akkermansia sp.]|nr:glycosyltransferase family 8 protein [Akkermansia sp.]